MIESSKDSITSLYWGFDMMSLMPLIDGNAVFGAALGGWLVTSTRRRFKSWQYLGSLLLSAGVGYLFSPVVMPFAPMLSSGAAAFVSSLLVIPISIKVMVWIDSSDLREIVARLRGGK